MDMETYTDRLKRSLEYTERELDHAKADLIDAITNDNYDDIFECFNLYLASRVLVKTVEELVDILDE